MHAAGFCKSAYKDAAAMSLTSLPFSLYFNCKDSPSPMAIASLRANRMLLAHAASCAPGTYQYRAGTVDHRSALPLEHCCNLFK